MIWTNTQTLAVVELAIYAGVLPVVVYTAYKHKIPGLLGHVYFIIFVTLRVIADALLISDRDAPAGTSTAAAIVNSIGLSPLLLTVVGIVNEARYYLIGRDQSRQNKRTIVVAEVITHVVVVTGVALLAKGSSGVFEATSSSDLNHETSLARAGALLLMLTWLSSCVWAGATYCQQRVQKLSTAPTILYSTMLALPFLGVRVLYTVVYTFDWSPSLNPSTGLFVVKLVPVFLMQILVAGVLLSGLLTTRNIAELSARQRDVSEALDNSLGCNHNRLAKS